MPAPSPDGAGATNAHQNTHQNRTKQTAPVRRRSMLCLYNPSGAADLLFFPVGANAEKRFAVFHRMPVFDKNAHHFARDIRFNLVHQFHGFNDAQYLAGFHFRADGHERLRARTGGRIERADDR